MERLGKKPGEKKEKTFSIRREESVGKRSMWKESTFERWGFPLSIFWSLSSSLLFRIYFTKMSWLFIFSSLLLRRKKPASPPFYSKQRPSPLLVSPINSEFRRKRGKNKRPSLSFPVQVWKKKGGGGKSESGGKLPEKERANFFYIFLAHFIFLGKPRPLRVTFRLFVRSKIGNFSSPSLPRRICQSSSEAKERKNWVGSNLQKSFLLLFRRRIAL